MFDGGKVKRRNVLHMAEHIYMSQARINTTSSDLGGALFIASLKTFLMRNTASKYFHRVILMYRAGKLARRRTR